MLFQCFFVMFVAMQVATQENSVQPPKTLPPATSSRIATGSNVATPPDEAAIREIIADNTQAYNRRDAKALAAHVSEDADHIGVSGKWVSGRAHLEKDLVEYFGESVPRPKTEHSIEKIRFVTPDVAIVIVKRSYRSDVRTRQSVATYVLKKTNHQWLITAFQNTFVE